MKVFFLQYNFLKPNAADLGSNPSDTTLASVKRLHHRTYQTFLQLKTPQNFIFQNQKFTSPFTFLGHHHLDHYATVCTIRNYDHLKQAFLFMPYENPNRPLIIPQEYLILNDDYLTPANMPTHVPELSPYFQKIISGPLTENGRSYYQTLVQKRYTNAKLMYIFAKFFTFLFNKQYKYGPFPSKTTQNSTVSSFTFIPPSNNTPPVVTINTFNFPTDLFINEILTLLRPHVDSDPHANPIDLIKNIFSIYKTLKDFSPDISQIHEILRKFRHPHLMPHQPNKTLLSGSSYLYSVHLKLPLNPILA